MPILESEVSRARSRRYARLYIPRTIVITVWEFLRTSGLEGREQLCFLAGRVVEDGGPSGSGAQVTSCVLPLTFSTAGFVTLTNHAQTSVVLDELERRHEQPLMSLHTHGDGGHAGCGPEHSEIDDHGVALTPEDGLFSGIVPHYALGSPFDFVEHTTVYERQAREWVKLSAESKADRILVYDETVRIVPVRAEARESG